MEVPAEFIENLQQDMQVDEYIYDNPLTTVVVAAGNFGRDGSYTVMTPAVAKNAITGT